MARLSARRDEPSYGPGVIASTGDIQEAYETLGVIHAVVTRPAKSAGCGGSGGLPIHEAFGEVTRSLQETAKSSGGDGVIHIGYSHRVSSANFGCQGDKAVFEVYGWGTVIRLKEVG